MIGYLEGEIKYATAGQAILFANGIGFTVHLPSNVNFLEGDRAVLFIHTHLREDNLSLFGFKTPEDLSLFEKLISVSGVGPKIGLAMFSCASSTSIITAISTSNLAFFTAIPGIGKKSAQKIILDLKSKISKGDVNLDSLEGNSELLDSLLGLGFQKQEVSQIIGQVDQSLPLPSQIRTALRLLNK